VETVFFAKEEHLKKVSEESLERAQGGCTTEFAHKAKMLSPGIK